MLERRDGARSAVMCFVSPRLATSLVTTHLPLSRGPADQRRGVANAAVALARLLRSLGARRVRLAVASPIRTPARASLGVEEARIPRHAHGAGDSRSHA
jgi:hypothetical protein